MMARTGACVVLILLGAGPVMVGEAGAGSMLSNLFQENHIRRPPRSIPKLGRAARVPLPQARPERAPPAAVAAKGPDAQTTATSTAVSPSSTVNDDKSAPAQPGAVIFPPVAPLE
jgi:hypothetical protein